MVNDIASDLYPNPPTGVLEEEEARLLTDRERAEAQVRNLLTQQTAAAQVAATVPDDGLAYSRHDVSGLGRYVIPRRTGWQFLLDIIHDPVPNIDFSANIYPNFDGIIGQHFNNTRLLDPLDDHYESYEPLRDNIAAVRNFLMERYFAVDSTMDESTARQNMAEIAAFIGDGLYNNHYFGGLIPNHDPDKPHIDFGRASEKGGAGAQYIYEQILAHNRHSSGFRPLDAIKEMFGGQKAVDWKLPEGDKTHFMEMFHHDLAPAEPIVDTSLEGVNALITGAYTKINEINARLDAVRDSKALSTIAGFLNNIGSHLIFTAENTEGVAQLDEPTRRRAVDIAKDILKNLKVTLGDKSVDKGLGVLPSADAAVFGSLKSVAKIYDRLQAWARGNGDTKILQNPAVIEATKAIGQMGYLAKQEALEKATKAGDSALVRTISEQLKLVPTRYIPKPGVKFGDLLDTIQNGMETILNRTQQVSVDGGQIGHALDGNLGGVNTIPTAGIGGQLGVGNAANRNQQASMAAELAAEAQAQALNAQIAAQARKQGQAQAAPSRSTTGRQGRTSLQAAKQQAAAVSSSRVSTTAPLTAAQQQAALRANTSAGLAARRLNALGHHDEHEEHEIEQLRLAQQRLAATKIKALKLPPMKGFDTKMTGAPITAGRVPTPQDILSSRAKTTPGIATQTIKTQSVDGAHHETPVDHSHDHDHELPPVQPPVPPTRGGGRGF